MRLSSKSLLISDQIRESYDFVTLFKTFSSLHFSHFSGQKCKYCSPISNQNSLKDHTLCDGKYHHSLHGMAGYLHPPPPPPPQPLLCNIRLISQLTALQIECYKRMLCNRTFSEARQFYITDGLTKITKRTNKEIRQQILKLS